MSHSNQSVAKAIPSLEEAGLGLPGSGLGSRIDREKVALYVLLAVISSLFFLFILAYLMRSTIGDWDSLAQPWNPLSNRSQLWLNTSMLLCSSIAFEYARRAAKKDNESAVLQGLMLAGLFAFSFLVGQIWVWNQLIGHGYLVNTNVANSFFYVFTALHGGHLIIGLAFWTLTMGRAWNNGNTAKVSKTTDLCATFWHFLFVLWLILFGLIAGPPETIALIASYCGII